jgi:hypothetical protein
MEQAGANSQNGQQNGLPEPRNADEAARALTGKPLSLGYQPSSALLYASGDPDGWLFNPYEIWIDIERMLTHPDVCQPYERYKSGISSVEFTVKARTEEEAKFAHVQLERLWHEALEQAQLCYDFGWCAYEIAYRWKGGKLNFDTLYPFHPLDSYAVTVRGQYVGCSVHGMGLAPVGVSLPLGKVNDSVEQGAGLGSGNFKLWGPGRWPAKGLWLTHNWRWHRWYGRTQLYSAWRPWKRLAGRDCAEEVTDGAFYRCAYRGPEVRYPPEDFQKGPNESINFDAARNAAREIGDNSKAGVSIALPNSRDKDGNFKWQVNFAEHAFDVAPLAAREDQLHKQISRGVGVPPELLEASEVGSGWSGRMIPLLGFYDGQVKNARSLVKQFLIQVVLPLLRWNFGPGAWCEAEVQVVLPPGLQPKQGTPGAGGAPGAPPAEAAPPDNPDTKPEGLPGGGAQAQGDGQGALLSLGDVLELATVGGATDPAQQGATEDAGAIAAGWAQRAIKSGLRKGQTAWVSPAGRLMPANYTPPHARQKVAPAAKAPASGRSTSAAPKAPGAKKEPRLKKATAEEVHGRIKAALADPEKIDTDTVHGIRDALLTLTVPEIQKLGTLLGVEKGKGKLNKSPLAERIGQLATQKAQAAHTASQAQKPAPQAPAAPAPPAPTPEQTRAQARVTAATARARTRVAGEAAAKAAPAPKRVSRPEESQTFHAWTSGAHALRPLVQGISDHFMADMNKELGYDAKPQVVSEADMDKLVAGGAQEMFRGVSGSQYVDAFKGGDFFAGLGAYGNGTYAARTGQEKVGDGSGETAWETAIDYTRGGNVFNPGDASNVMRMALKPGARVARGDELKRLESAQAKELEVLQRAHDSEADVGKKAALKRKAEVVSDLGRYAALHGYDAMDNVFTIILNRGSVVVQKEPAKAQGSVAGKQAPEPEPEKERENIDFGDF